MEVNIVKWVAVQMKTLDLLDTLKVWRRNELFLVASLYFLPVTVLAHTTYPWFCVMQAGTRNSSLDDTKN